MNQDVLAQNDMYSSMENEKPFACYIKTILAQVAVTVWDNVQKKPVDVILHGDPKKKDEDSYVKVWSQQEDGFLKRVNRGHFKKGVLVSYKLPENYEPPVTIEQASDEELTVIVNSKWIAFVNRINKIESIPVLFRMRGIAEELEKSEKVTSAIEKRISELQTAEYITPNNQEA